MMSHTAPKAYEAYVKAREDEEYNGYGSLLQTSSVAWISGNHVRSRPARKRTRLHKKRSSTSSRQCCSMKCSYEGRSWTLEPKRKQCLGAHHSWAESRFGCGEKPYATTVKITARQLCGDDFHKIRCHRTEAAFSSCGLSTL